MTALITGASGGIGAELARLFAKDGIDLLLVARTAEKLLACKSELETTCHVSVVVLAKDLSEDGAAQAVFDFAQANHIPVDVLVNNAGFGDWGFFAESDLAKQRQMIQLNIAALTELTHLFLPAMIARKNGRILNVASVARYGYRTMKKGRTLAIPGLSVRIAVALARILPRAFVRNLVYAAQK